MSAFDRRIRSERKCAYELGLQVGSALGVEHLTDPDLLQEEWDAMIRPAAVIETRHPWIDTHRNWS